jgi:hypothetical protein
MGEQLLDIQCNKKLEGKASKSHDLKPSKANDLDYRGHKGTN